jgi:hypothetical protein
MSISLVNVAKFYRGLSYQDQALQLLQQQIEVTHPELLSDSSEFVRLWRNVGPIDANSLITAAGLGAAHVGVSYQQLRQALPANATYSVVAPFIVDFDAIAVSLNGEDTAFYILYPAGTTFVDSSIVESLMTGSPKYRTPEGIGPGVLVQKAVQFYGQATLSYNTDNESREFVRFAHQPAPNLFFRPDACSYPFAGIYPTTSEPFHETTAFHESASICQVMVNRVHT